MPQLRLTAHPPTPGLRRLLRQLGFRIIWMKGSSGVIVGLRNFLVQGVLPDALPQPQAVLVGADIRQH
jgi:hypothetical protein